MRICCFIFIALCLTQLLIRLLNFARCSTSALHCFITSILWNNFLKDFIPRAACILPLSFEVVRIYRPNLDGGHFTRVLYDQLLGEKLICICIDGYAIVRVHRTGLMVELPRGVVMRLSSSIQQDQSSVFVPVSCVVRCELFIVPPVKILYLCNAMLVATAPTL